MERSVAVPGARWLLQHPGGGAALVTPTKVFAHAKGEPFGATTHKF
jgi:hypothetical protein